jgi:hypothetical protein
MPHPTRNNEKRIIRPVVGILLFKGYVKALLMGRLDEPEKENPEKSAATLLLHQSPNPEP